MAGPVTLRPALFIDRDGTLIADAHYLSDASRVALLPDAAVAVQRANAAGIPVVIVTNQSGIARGLITPSQYAATRDRTVTLLADAGADVLATYHCPHWAEVTGACDCRKPGLGMYRQAAHDHGLALDRSAYIGDRWRDVQPAIATGGVGILVPGMETPHSDVEIARSSTEPRVYLADSLLAAVQRAIALVLPHRPPIAATTIPTE
ncbi:MAG: D-glycero-alpha-D-manno-heptose-1,7-bisphosphate 7-phosphatase [Gemmatimonas sp.]|jgi:D-glycero-D-manno-heptose 1,7-bisphosphate phosphatase|uniref:D-glycero-alpha-D-manno-heptose-1,7-bisphosphate 7-phosphatase n=1 Tax=Gemmatimonas sp. TaxID=1962908 RepID=UPI00391F52A8|nr:HAD family hydrolase [Gemmatimonadota bacterium]